jgi:hypothetical protein
MEGAGEIRTKEEWRNDFRGALRSFERAYPPDSFDRTTGYFARAARMAIEHEDFYDLVYEAHQFQPQVKPKEAVSILRSGYQAYLLEQRKNDLTTFPRNFTEEKWLDTFSEVEDDMIQWGILRNNVCNNRMQSNIAERYKFVQLMSVVLKERLGDNPTILDVGSSELHGGKKLAFGNQSNLGCKPFENVRLSYRHEIDNKLTFSFSRRLSRIANFALRQRVEFADIYGVDLTPIDDERVKLWVKSNSLRPDELSDPVKEAEYDLLDNLDPEHERVKFSMTDFASKSEVDKFIKNSSVKKFKLIVFSAVLYQAEPEEQQAMLENAYELLDEDGLIIIMDDKEGNFDQKYTFVASIIDANDIEAGEQKIIRFESGRCKRGFVEDGKVIIDRKKRYFIDLLLKSA